MLTKSFHRFVPLLTFTRFPPFLLGKPVELVLTEEADLDAGILNVEMPLIAHPSIPVEQREAFTSVAWVGVLNATAKGAWIVSDEWNKLLPDVKFRTVEGEVRKVFGKK